ncbi:hypothetical protein A3F37_04135 [Candidatus Saccharibacteria bacterium RIFCSPHIGHO2_12_FULL_41_12]|nr:MAG: hypothetical protein A3F37_04135 [Candidatus Saccharibacteria bacterium RIFCSPHIGHO2_12_FULL_41_12]
MKQKAELPKVRFKKGMKKTIAIDIDDVIAQHVPEFIEFSNKNYNTNLSMHDYRDHWAEIWQVDHEEMKKRELDFHSKRVHNFKKLKEADRVLEFLKENYDLVIVTARPQYLVDSTHVWLERFYDGIFSDVHFVPIWEAGSKITKADVCRQIGADYLIDDMPLHCNIASSAGITALLFGDYPWNRNLDLSEGVVRVNKWSDVAEYFDAKN